MKILLVAVNAKYIHSNLAVYSLKAFAHKYRDNITIGEFTINHNIEAILKSIYKEKADVIAFSCYIWNFAIITKLVKEISKVQPQAKIWFGGPEVSYDSELCLKSHKELAGIIIGEGEQTFLELVEYYVDHKTELTKIPGLIFNKKACWYGEEEKLGKNTIKTTVRNILNLNEIPFPYEDLEIFRNRIIYYESSRGCPFSCSYCLSSIDKKVRLKDVELVKKDIKIFLDYQVPQVKFVDRTFNCNKNHAIEIWRFLKEEDNGITNFHFEISADLLSEEELCVLSTLRPGLVQFEIGVQSTNPKTLEAIHRRMDFTKLTKNVQRIYKGKNIHQHLDLIAGLPYEDFNSFINSFHDVYELKPDQLQLGFLKVLKGSLMDQEKEQYGLKYLSFTPYEVLTTNWISYEELLILKEVCEMIEIYYNSGQFSYCIQFLEYFYDKPFDLFRDLASFYEIKQLDQLAHSRIRRYELLLDFFKEKVILLHHAGNQELINVFQEILVLDLCLRDNLRSRPKFAGPSLEHKVINYYYDKYEIKKQNAHIEKFAYDVIASANLGKAVCNENYTIFDYSNKDPLNKGARIIQEYIN